jgi:hypothetical protein
MKPPGQPSSRSASPRPFPHPGKLHNPAHALWAYNLSRRSDGFKKRMPVKMIFREMRRKKQLLSEADAIAILNSCIIEREWDRVCLVEVAIEHITGKAAIELLKQKES